MIIQFQFLQLTAFFLLIIESSIAQPVQDNPVVITPGANGQPPSDAVVLFKKNSLDAFESVNGGPATWIVNGKKFTVNPGSKNIQTRQKFGDCQLHIEWLTPKKDVKAGKTGQGCGNSGIYMMGKYEVQVLNSFINETDADRQAGALYHQHVPMVNASMAPGKWQVYDIIFSAPRFDTSGKQTEPGYLTVFHNGVLIQNHVEVSAPTRAHSTQFKISEKELPLMLQDHNSEVSYRNIWIRKLD